MLTSAHSSITPGVKLWTQSLVPTQAAWAPLCDLKAPLVPTDTYPNCHLPIESFITRDLLHGIELRPTSIHLPGLVQIFPSYD